MGYHNVFHTLRKHKKLTQIQVAMRLNDSVIVDHTRISKLERQPVQHLSGQSQLVSELLRVYSLDDTDPLYHLVLMMSLNSPGVHITDDIITLAVAAASLCREAQGKDTLVNLGDARYVAKHVFEVHDRTIRTKHGIEIDGTF